MERQPKSMAARLLVLLFGVAGLTAGAARAQSPLKRFAAEFRNFDATESVTDLGVPGISVYSKTLVTGSDVNTLYITISATADTHRGNAAWFNCNVDNVDCNSGFGGAGGAPAGWIALSKHFNYDSPVTYNGGSTGGDGGGGTGDMHDNSIYYTWCTPVSAGTHTIQIRLASSLTGGGTTPTGADHVFFEAAHFYIDGSKPVAGSACVAGTS